MEEWKDIDGYVGYYQISNIGNARSLTRVVTSTSGRRRTVYGADVKKIVDKDGYIVVRLSRDGIRKTYPIHRLVASAFVDGYFDGAEVDHLDSNRANNTASNLKWCTHAENVRHSIEEGNHFCTRDISGSNNPNFGNHVLRDKYLSDRDLCIKNQSRKGKQNGRATRVSLYDGCRYIQFDTISSCAEYVSRDLCLDMTSSHIANMISNAAKNGEEYLGLKFYFC